MLVSLFPIAFVFIAVLELVPCFRRVLRGISRSVHGSKSLHIHPVAFNARCLTPC